MTKVVTEQKKGALPAHPPQAAEERFNFSDWGE
jgi:hypothetical protein